MKINIDIDCTPAEARAFFGLPDVKPLQDHLLKDIEDRLAANLKAMDADHLLKTWLPSGIQGFEKMQNALWGQLMGGLNKGGDSPGSK